jgi:hypothetical protein
VIAESPARRVQVAMRFLPSDQGLTESCTAKAICREIASFRSFLRISTTGDQRRHGSFIQKGRSSRSLAGAKQYKKCSNMSLSALL